LTDVHPDDFDLFTVPDHLARHGDPLTALDDQAYDLTEALSWYDRDIRDGLTDMPYPPDYPKMPGEPMRVQPSRARNQGEPG
jgi:hypothetical protein